jgi:histidyl-tRNA synthetase
LGEETKSLALSIANQLRAQGISTEMAFGERALKGAMKAADKSGARFVVVIGDSEISEGVVEIKRMEDGAVNSVKITQLAAELKTLLRRDVNAQGK